jgi:hypothetical protein
LSYVTVHGHVNCEEHRVLRGFPLITSVDILITLILLGYYCLIYTFSLIW